MERSLVLSLSLPFFPFRAAWLGAVLANSCGSRQIRFALGLRDHHEDTKISRLVAQPDSRCLVRKHPSSITIQTNTRRGITVHSLLGSRRLNRGRLGCTCESGLIRSLRLHQLVCIVHFPDRARDGDKRKSAIWLQKKMKRKMRVPSWSSLTGLGLCQE